MRRFFVIGSGLVASFSSFAKERDYPFIAGEYEVIGRYQDSRQTYSGLVILEAKKQGWTVTRHIGDTVQKGSASVEAALGDGGEVLKVQFEHAGQRFNATYILATDFDNDGRFSGYVVTDHYTGNQPGKEILFALKEGEKRPRSTKN